jgi:hypothetical protein
MNINDINGLICIDLWEQDPTGQRWSETYQCWLALLAERLSSMTFHGIINASFHTQIDFADPSIFNTFIRHNWQDFNQDIMMSVVRGCNNFVMSKEIIHQVFGSHTFFYNTTEHFLQHQAQFTPYITKWLVVGNTWPICTHRSEMGLTGFSALTRHPDFAHLSFYGTPWGFIKENDTVCTANDFVDDQYVQWQQLSNELFQLK